MSVGLARLLRERLDRPEWVRIRSELANRASVVRPTGAWNGLISALAGVPRLRLRPALRRYRLDKLKVLDVGASFGLNLPFFGADSLGLELEEENVLAGQALGLPVLQCDVLSERFVSLTAPESFDAAWCYAVIEHVAEPHTFLMRIRSRLRDSGLLILGAPTIPRYPRLSGITQAGVRKIYGGSRPEFSYLAADHVNAFTTDTLAFAVERAGFDVEYRGSLLFANHFVDRLAAPVSRCFFDDESLIVARRRANFDYAPKATRRATMDGWSYRTTLPPASRLATSS